LIYEIHSIISKECAERGAGGDTIREILASEKKVVSSADYVVVLSDEAEEFYRLINPQITVIPATVKEVSCNAKQLVGSGDGTKKVGLVGPYDNPRNLAELRFVYENLGRFDGRIRFRVLGIFSERMDDPRMEYLGFLASKQDFLESISALDAVIVPSRIATFGPLTKIVETMMCGVPVFTTPKGATGLSHLVDGVNIFISPEEDIVERVNKSLFDDSLMRRVGAEAKRTIHEHFSAEANSKKLFELVDKTLAERRHH
jgi:glycosyltransferase involved in cell wall biosynthesis